MAPHTFFICVCLFIRNIVSFELHSFKSFFSQSVYPGKHFIDLPLEYWKNKFSFSVEFFSTCIFLTLFLQKLKEKENKLGLTKSLILNIERPKN